MTDMQQLARRFEASRSRLHAIATRLLHSAADADDAVQETWMRLQRSDAAAIVSLEAWLTTVVSRVSLDLLKAPRRSRERSWNVEPWRDEPVAETPDPAETVAAADRIEVALLTVLEVLTPSERVAFVLHDVFGLPFDEIADALEKTPAAARQLASRARRRMREAPTLEGPQRRGSRQLVEAWLTAARDGDLRVLLSLLDGGAVLRAEYGASTQTLRGAEEIAGQAVLSARLAAHATLVRIDGLPGVAAVAHGRAVSIMAFEWGPDDTIVALHVLADRARLIAAGVDEALAAG